MRNALLYILGLGVLLGGLHLVFSRKAASEALVPSRIVPDAGGRLREVAIHFVPGAEYAYPAWRDFLRGLDEDVTVYVVCENEAAWEKGRETFRSWGLGDSSRFRPRFLEKALTPWNRDRMIATDRILWAPPEPHVGGPERKNEWRVPWVLGGHGREVRVAPFRFEGGDLIATEKHVFATEVLVGRNPDLAREELSRRVEELCGRKLVLIEGEVPFHHAGMFLTPIDDRRIVVGDARLGAKATGLPLDAEMARRLDHVAAVLRDRGFEIHRSPLAPTGQDFAWVTYNNNVISGRTIYLPAYGIAADEVAARLYRGLGLRVVPVDVRGIYRMGGTLRCLLHVLRRDRVGVRR